MSDWAVLCQSKHWLCVYAQDGPEYYLSFSLWDALAWFVIYIVVSGAVGYVIWRCLRG